MKRNEPTGESIDEVLGLPQPVTGDIVLNPAQLRRIWLGTARSVNSIVVRELPFEGALTTLAPSGSHWKISVTYTGISQHPPAATRIWAEALAIASLQLGVRPAPRSGRWCLRFWLPLCRAGEEVLLLLHKEVAPVLSTAADVLRKLGDYGPAETILHHH